MTLLLIAVGGMLLLAGMGLGVTLLAGVQMPASGPPSAKSTPPRVRWWWRRAMLLAVPVGLLAMLLTGWLAAGFAAAAVVLVGPTLLRPSAGTRQHIARLKGLASWTRRLADLLSSGAAQTLQDALAKAAATSPPALTEEATALASRMGPQGLEPALRQFAREIADPVGDHVAMALIVRARHGGIGLADVLASLAADVDEQVRMREAILLEQTKQISTARSVVVITVLFATLLAVGARTYMAPYGEPVGQVALIVIVVGFGLTVAWFQRLARPVVGARFLDDLPADEPGHAGVVR